MRTYQQFEKGISMMFDRNNRIRRIHLMVAVALALVSFGVTAHAEDMTVARVMAAGGSNTLRSNTLRVSSSNPRYFTDNSGKAIYLTGSHTWGNFQKWFEGHSGGGGTAGSPANFTAYLDVLQSYQHNFIRLWVADTAWSPIRQAAIEPQPYVRTGPGTAADGGLKFNLNQFNQAYFDTLRSQVIAARDRGIYVSLMLFDGWGISEYSAVPDNATWNYHPFRTTNNINGINGDTNGDGIGLEYHTLNIAAIKTIQEAYVRKVVDTVNDLDNVLYEICNESGNYSTAWQYYFIDFIKSYEAGKPKQHPVGMTFQYSDRGGGPNSNLFSSNADWASPGLGTYFADPPAADGSKVVIADTDHISSQSWDTTWIWRSFTRGLNPIVMDWWNGTRWDPIRRAMRDSRAYADKMNLAAMTPQGSLVSTGYALVNPGNEYLVYNSGSGTITLYNFPSGTYSVEWYNTATNAAQTGSNITGNGSNKTITPPFSGAVLYLKKKEL
ncbi:MAG: DUF6298 domain-containing protein [Sedimentisphaerales bacterium]|nr:DUF6298 domain-containing protein [Sedimentisphaerales bacterium]